MVKDAHISSCRAIEALRSGIPNRDVVQALGSSQLQVEDRFRQLLADVQQQAPLAAAPEGIVFSGDFGTGKSHLIEYLRHLALQQNFVCSKVVVSKETPLYDPLKIFRAAMQWAEAPEWAGTLLSAVANRLDFDSPQFEQFRRWAFDSDVGLDSRFPASLLVYQECRGNRYPEISDGIARFWQGSRIQERDLKSWLDELGQRAEFKFSKTSEQDLAWQRYQFISHLIGAAGFSGWVILIDEVELIGRYSLMQRATSYAQMARFLGTIEEFKIPGLATAFAITTAYQSEVMDEKRDAELVADHLGFSGSQNDLILSVHARLGMEKIRQIPQENAQLTESVDLQKVYEKCRAVYASAYGWEPPAQFETHPTWRIRQHIKRWINGWDLGRVFPDLSAELQVSKLEQKYSEDPDLVKTTREDPEDQEDRETKTPAGIRPAFAVLGGSAAQTGRVFTPERRVTQLSGDPVYDIEWRWCVPGYDMPWQFASGPNLHEERLTWGFDQTQKGLSTEKWADLNDDQIGIELRFQWQRRWRRELHRFAFVTHQLVDGKTHWKIGMEVLPTITTDE